MPHLITIIKYACYIVKYILVLLSAFSGRAVWVRVANGTSGSFCLDWRPKWVCLVILGNGFAGMVASVWTGGPRGYPGLSYYEL